MNQKVKKPVSQFTEKQRTAMRACLQFISVGSDFQASKGALVSAIRRSGAYERQHDAVKTLKMFLKNPEVPLELEADQVVRKDIRTSEGGRA